MNKVIIWIGLILLAITPIVYLKKETTYSEFKDYSVGDYLNGNILFNHFINNADGWLIPTLLGDITYQQNLYNNSGRCLTADMIYTGASCGSTGGLYTMGNISWPFTTSSDSCGIHLNVKDISSGSNGNIMVSIGTACTQSDIISFEKRFSWDGSCDVKSQNMDIFKLQPSTTYYITLSTNKYDCASSQGICLKHTESPLIVSAIELSNIICI